MISKTFDIAYYNNNIYSHKLKEAWGKSELFCPSCGKREVWVEFGDGDFYVGVAHICTNCKKLFYLPDGLEDITDDKQGAQRIDFLKANKDIKI